MSESTRTAGIAGVDFPPLPSPLPPPPPPTPPVVTLPQQPFPPHEPFPRIPGPIPPIRVHAVRCGCYYINYTPLASRLVTYDGTLRVECDASGGRTASGDLYQRLVIPLLPGSVLAPPPNPAAGIPIFPRGQYRYYLAVTQILEHFTLGNSFVLGFDMWRFQASALSWTKVDSFTAQMVWTPAPAGYPAPGDYLAGDVKNSAGVVVGRLTMGWVSSYLRRATVEIDRVAAAEAPLNNGAGIDWRDVGNSIGWDISAAQSNANLAEVSGESWSDAECHAEMLAWRAAVNLDREWRYYVLCVRRLDSTPRGIMFDAYATDSNHVPREGCALSSAWIIPASPEWGTVQGMRFGAAAAPYFRTVIHETGHAMGLYHNTFDNGFMNTTDVIAANSLSPGSAAFPANVAWAYAPDDQRRLRHMPDIYVRPGGVPFGTAYPTSQMSGLDEVVDVPHLQLRVSPLLPTVPLGAPIRVNLSLTNRGGTATMAPPSLAMSAGFVKGTVMDIDGRQRDFTPLVICSDQAPLVKLEPGAKMSNSLTLVRGADGALFPRAGAYRVRVEAHWEFEGVEYQAAGETRVIVTPAHDEVHARAASRVLGEPDVLLTLALGGDHNKAGNEAVQTALRDAVLRPHFAFIEAKRLAQRFQKRAADVEAAFSLIDDATVMSPAEVAKARKLNEATSDARVAKTIAKKLQQKGEDAERRAATADAADALA